MRTGEGKTIVCYMANYMKVLQGLKVHMVTVNDYLVRRDAEFCRPIFELLGVTVGFISADMGTFGQDAEVRRAAYACDITYGTNSEFGFDYLRDNMKHSVRDQVQGRLNFVVVDEVDSILIDEARTPLIISGPAHDDISKYRVADNIARLLARKQEQANRDMARRIDDLEKNAPKEQRDDAKFKDGVKKFRSDPFWLSSEEGEAIGHMQYFVVELDRKSAHMTEHGAKAAQAELGIGTFYDSKNMNWPHYIDNALKAHLVYQRDKEYVVQEGQVVIVDEFTGRLMVGRQWSDGLHQAVEAKEGVTVKQESQTLATITLQNFFKLYNELAGMTGTAMTEADEFMKIYKLEVIAIPTNQAIRRNDFNDKIYKTVETKYEAIVDEIRSYSQSGYPADPWSLFDMLKAARRTIKETIKYSSADTSAEKAKLPIVEQALAAFNEGKGDEKALEEGYTKLMEGRFGGRPVLVGTTSVENSEKLSQMLTKRHGIDHEVLNAKNHAREAEIVAKAGQQHEQVRGKKKMMVGNVTIATNMAGRGTDIVLGPGVGGKSRQKVVGNARDRHRAARKPPHRQSASRPLRAAGRPGQLALLPVARGRPAQALHGRVGAQDAQHARLRRGHGDRGQAAQQGHRAGPEEGRGAELRHPQEPARIRRGDGPPAQDLLLDAPAGGRKPRHQRIGLGHDRRDGHGRGPSLLRPALPGQLRGRVGRPASRSVDRG
jgi:preprotein translocase subunit SecA